jgi:cobalamin biosynthesis protein CobT
MATKSARKRRSASTPVPPAATEQNASPVLPAGAPLPRERDLAGRVAPPDGGVREHPVHDDDLEDLGPEDYEEQIEKVEDQTLDEHPDGSAPPLDRLIKDTERR